MVIGILGAMKEEIALLREQLANVRLEQHGHLTWLRGTRGHIDVVVSECGIGKVSAAVATTLLQTHYKPDAIINTGSAGGFDPRLAVGDIVIADAVQHHDVDVTPFGFELGQVFGLPTFYECAPSLVEAATRAAERATEQHVVQGLIGTGDAFIGSDDAVAKLRQQFPNIKAVEMEGAAVGQSCHLLGVPFVVIRSLSDVAGHSSFTSFEQYLHLAARNSAQLVLDMLDHL